MWQFGDADEKQCALEAEPTQALSPIRVDLARAALSQKAVQVLPEGVNVPGLGFGDALRGAVCFNHLQTLKALLTGGAPKSAVLEPDSDGWSLLHVAAFHGGVDIVTVLLDHGDDDGCWLDVDWYVSGSLHYRQLV